MRSRAHAASFSSRSASSLMGFFASNFTSSNGVFPVPFVAFVSAPFSSNARTANTFPYPHA
eukprot:31044-Pelagococcus_subviridis.AAC.3